MAQCEKKALRNTAGCSRKVIRRGAALPAWTFDGLISRTIDAMQPPAGTPGAETLWHNFLDSFRQSAIMVGGGSWFC